MKANLQNNTFRKVAISSGIAVIIAFTSFTVHKIYVQDPHSYAQTKDVTTFITESRTGRAAIKTLAMQNKETIEKIMVHLQYIKESQIELKEQSARTQAIQLKIYETLKNINGNVLY